MSSNPIPPRHGRAKKKKTRIWPWVVVFLCFLGAAVGFENNIAGCSCVTPEVAARAIQMLKNKMAGVEVKPAPKKWNNAVINANNDLLGLSETVLVDSGTLH